MSRKEILVIDRLVIGYNHIVFNTAFTSIIANIYKNNDVVFICESIHGNIIADKNQNVSNLKVETFVENHLPLSNLKKIIPWVRKKLTDIFFIKKISNKRAKNSDGVFFTCLSTTSLLYASYAAKKIKTPVYFFIHGEIEYIFKKKISFVSKVRGKIYKSFLKGLGDNSKILVLSELIKTRLIEDGILPSNKIIFVEHPIVFAPREEKSIIQEKTIFGHIGIALEKKGSTCFFKLAALFKSAIEEKKAEFCLVGKMEKDLAVDDISCVNILSKNNDSLTQLQFEQGINLIDYSIFTFDEENYVYRASGTVMDAIAYVKPIIALKQDFFNHLFNQAGNIGFLCNDFEELKLLVQSIINRDEDLLEQYYAQQQNLKKLRQKHLVQVIEDSLLSAIKSNMR